MLSFIPKKRLWKATEMAAGWRRPHSYMGHGAIVHPVWLYWYHDIEASHACLHLLLRRRRPQKTSQWALCVRHVPLRTIRREKKIEINKSCEFRNPHVTIMIRMTWVIKSSFTPRAFRVFYAAVSILFNHIKENFLHLFIWFAHSQLSHTQGEG